VRNIDYNTIFELNDITLEDCQNLYNKESLCAVINDGRLINFEKEVVKDCFEKRVKRNYKKKYNNKGRRN
jgi:hypothetical protein